MLDAGADTIVLGCTHYPFLKTVIEKLAGPGVMVIDPAPAVVRQLVNVLDQEGISHSNPGDPLIEDHVTLMSSGPEDALIRTAKLV